MSNVLQLGRFNFTTSKDQYNLLKLDQEIQNVKDNMKREDITARKKSHLVDYMYPYKLNITAYYKILRTFKSTKVGDVYWRMCPLRGIFEFIYLNGRIVINLE